jgi:hypothetical protein
MAMQIGLLWFDNDPHRELAAKIEDAARRYREKFGMVPNTCYVNQATWDGQSTVVRGRVAVPALRVIPAGNILPHHFWVGVEES